MKTIWLRYWDNSEEYGMIVYNWRPWVACLGALLAYIPHLNCNYKTLWIGKFFRTKLCYQFNLPTNNEEIIYMYMYRTILSYQSIPRSPYVSLPDIWDCPSQCRLDSALLDILKKDTEGRLGRWREQSIALGLLVGEATRKVEEDVDETDYGDIQASSVQLQVRWNGHFCEVLGFGCLIRANQTEKKV